MTDANFKVKNGLNVGSSGVIEFDDTTSRLTVSNDGGTTSSPVMAAAAETKTKTADHTLELADAGAVVEMNVASANTVTVPHDDIVNFPDGTKIEIVQVGVGQTEIVSGLGNPLPNDASGLWVTRSVGMFPDDWVEAVSYGNGTWALFTSENFTLQTSTDTISWVSRSFPSVRGVRSVVYENSIWVAVGNYATIHTSTDAITWTERSSSLPSNFMWTLRDIEYNGSIWAAFGDSGAITTSTDATTWVSRTSNFGSTSVRSAAFGNDLWVAVGDSGQLRTSTDAVTWVTRTSNFGTTAIRSVDFGNNTWVAVGYSGQIRTSTDAVTWTTRTSNFGTINILTLEYANNVWVAAGYYGQVRRSTDGITWVTQASNFNSSEIYLGTIQDLAFGNDTWIAVGAYANVRTVSPTVPQTTISSKNFVNKILNKFGKVSLYKRSASSWVLEGDLSEASDAKTGNYVLGLSDVNSTVTIDSSQQSIVTIPHDSNASIPVGSRINVVQAGEGSTKISAGADVVQPSSWTTVTISSGDYGFSEVLYVDDTWIAIDRLGLVSFRSTDAVTWTSSTVSRLGPSLYKLAYADGMWVGLEANDGRLYSSTDSVLWHQRVTPFGNSTFAIRSVAYGNNLWTAVGNYGVVATSTDTITWTTVISGFNSNPQAFTGPTVFSVAYGDGKWAAVNAWAQVTTSTDGVRWLASNSNFASSILSIAYGNGLWVAGGVNGELKTSTDAKSWTNQTSNFSNNIEYIKYDDGVWVALSSSTSSQIRTSTDAITWVTQQSNIPSTKIVSVNYGGGKWVAAFGPSGFSGFPNDTLLVAPGGSSFVSIESSSPSIEVSKKSGQVSLQKTAANTWSVSGDVATAPQQADSDYVISDVDIDRVIESSSVLDTTIIVPSNAQDAIALGSRVKVVRSGASKVDFSSPRYTYPPTAWAQISYSNSQGQLYGIEYADNLWVAVGSASFGGPGIQTSTDAITWVSRQSNLSSYAFDVAYGNGTWVAVGNYGNIRTSTDGVAWVTRTSNFPAQQFSIIRSAKYGGNTWVIAGTYGIRTSTDAITWVTRTSNFNTEVQSIDYGNGLWVGTDDSGQIRTSTDAITWVTRVSNLNVRARTVAYLNDKWVLFGDNGPLRTSTNGVTWVTGPDYLGNSGGNTMWVQDADYFNGVYVAVGFEHIATSTDGVTWTTANAYAFSDAYGVAYGNGVWAVARSNGAGIDISPEDFEVANLVVPNGRRAEISKPDGVVSLYKSGKNEWVLSGDLIEQSQTKTASYNITVNDAESIIEMNVASANTVTVPVDSVANLPVGSRIDIKQVGVGQTEIVADSSGIEPSSWVTRTSNFGSTIVRAIAFANGVWVAGSYQGQLRTSTDAITWTTRTSNFGTTDITSVAFGGGVWVAGGYRGELRTSTDAVTWVTRTSNFQTFQAINGLTHGNGRWVAGGWYGGEMRTSTDAVTWVTQNSNFGSTGISDIAFGDNTWVAVGYSGQIRTSTDAITWVTRTSNFGTRDIASVAYGNGTWVAAGDLSQIRTSTNAVTWATIFAPGDDTFRGVAYANDVWVLVNDKGSGGEVFTSKNLSSWTTQVSNFGTSIFNVAYGNGTWVAVGNLGRIRTASETIESVSILSKDFQTKISSRYGSASLYKRSANTWLLEFDSTVDLSAAQTLSNKTLSTAILVAPEERCNVVAAAATGTINVELLTAGVWLYTSDASADFTLNFRGSSTTTLNSILAVGDAITAVFINTNGATARRPTVFQIDGNAVTPIWQGGSAPTAGNANSRDAYTFTIIKTAATPTYLVLGAQTRFA